MTEESAGPDSQDAGDSQDATVSEGELADDQDGTDVTVTPQSEELKRQQVVVGVIVAVLTALAVSISLTQNFSGIPTPISVSSGIVGGGVVYWIVQNSLFPTESEVSAE